MRKGRHGVWGLTAILAGIVIILALILPAAFWWFSLAALLIGFGVWLLRCC